MTPTIIPGPDQPRLARALQALHEIAVAAARGVEPTALARLAVRHARTLLGVDAASLYWRNPATAVLEGLAHTDRRRSGAAVATRPGQGAAGQAFLQRAPVVVEDYPTWPHAHPHVSLAQIRSAAAVPLQLGAHPVGALLVRTYQPHHFTPADVQLLTVLGAQVGPALEAARLVAAEKAATAALRERERELRTLYEALPCGVLVRGPGGAIIHANRGAELLLGLPAEQMYGQTPEGLWQAIREDGSPLPPAERPGVIAVRTGQPVRNCTVGIIRADGQPRWFQVDSVPVFRPDGALYQVVSSFIDITALREAQQRQQALAKTERLRTLGQMATGIAHNLNQSLCIIAGYADLAQEAVAQPFLDRSDLGSMLEQVAQAAMDGGDTVKRLLRFARAQEGEPREVIDCGDLLEDVAEFTAPHWRDTAQTEGRPIRMTVEGEGEVTIAGAPARLREALTNLVFNAIDALPHGGRILLATWRDGDQVLVEVVDSGVGMSPDVQERALEPFFTTKGARGSGLGLAMVASIVEQNGGQIAIRSAPQEGTAVNLRFPAVLSPAPVLSASIPPAVPAARPLRILAVDDELAQGRMVAHMLGRQGHAVATATSGDEALDRLTAEAFDLVITDVAMGTGMNGWDLAAAVRQRWPTTRVVLATGWGAAIDPVEAHTRGVAGVLHKPYRIDDLRRAIEALGRV